MKKIFICLTILFSIFLFNNKINAQSTVIWTGRGDGVLQGTLTSEHLKKIIEYNNLDVSIYDSFVIYDNSGYKSARYFTELGIYFYNSDDYKNQYVSYGKGSASAYFYNSDGSKGVYYLQIYYAEKTDFFDMMNFDWFNYEQSLQYIVGRYQRNMMVNEYEYYPASGLISDYVDLTELTNYNITLHLNGGSSWDTNQICNNIGCYIVGNKYEDYTISVSKDNLISYLKNVYITKEPMQFIGWYYDEKLTQKVNSTDTINSDQHFYAKYEYKNVEDFLNNTNFNSYTFDENYLYAIISLNNQENRDIYLGLDIFTTNLEIYKYNKVNLNYEQGSNICLTPIFSKENKYYYQVSDSLDNNYEVLIIPKDKLKGNYNFLLSDNAHVTYTNDLKQVVIKDETGNDITTDVEDSYNYSQDNLLNSENDLLDIFKDLINNKDNNVLAYFNQVWNYLKRSRIFSYFITLIIGALIILIIKAAAR